MKGMMELKTTADVTAFIDTDVTVIKGDLIIGSDAEDAEELSDIAALKILKESKETSSFGKVMLDKILRDLIISLQLEVCK